LINTQEINVELVYPIRQLVLRKGKPIESCYFIEDDKDTTTHFGLLLEAKVVGVVSLFEQKNQIFTEEKQFQIRGMAVLEEHQKKGFGKILIHKAEEYCKKYKGTIIWFNARESAQEFYEKLNYKSTGNPFYIKDIGIHYIMFKKMA
jgi:GNAT superfamily N-acetyltransferase